MLTNTQYSVVATRGNEIVLSDPTTFSRFVYREFPLDGQQALLQSNSPSLVPIISLHLDEAAHHAAVLWEYYDCTLGDLPGSQFDEGDLVNTLEQILILLRELGTVEYGLMDKANVCFWNGEVRLLAGEPKTKREEGETTGERDFRVLGLIIA